MAGDTLLPGDHQLATAGSTPAGLPPDTAANNQANGKEFAQLSGADRGTNGSVPPATFNGDHIDFGASTGAGNQGGGFWNGVGNALVKADDLMYKNFGLGDSDAPNRSGQPVEMPGS
jgi:hypothetical protein